ncbi:MAG: bifunctional phosphopantothenoylcysteine decarboxylase/phosphopantothenate--cysteine ligase CoaBC [Bryobacteraceae bacterium]
MRIALGVGGGIAAYKSALLTRALQERGHDVQAVMTRAACQFLQPLTLAALTGHKVITELFSAAGAEETLSSAVEHIAVAKDCDALVVAPATADILAKFAHGSADDFLSTLYLAFTGPIVLAPSMNTAMWQHAATQANRETLRSRGCHFVDPDDGWLACGTVGAGRMAEPAHIAENVDLWTQRRTDLDGETILITAGPTQEPLDPVRYITNRSSGKMGYALAQASAHRGARVILISGPVNLPKPAGMEVIQIRTTHEMRDAVMSHLERATIIIKSAAVADYFVSNVPKQKLKKTAARWSLDLEPTPDILAEIGQKKGDRLLIGFAAETQNLLEETRRKLASKNCDMLVGNLVNQEGTGFESDRNEVIIVTRAGDTTHVGPADKLEIAGKILDQVPLLRLSLRHLDQPA